MNNEGLEQWTCADILNATRENDAESVRQAIDDKSVDVNAWIDHTQDGCQW